MKIAVCIIATNKYREFIPQLSRSICNNFLLDHEIEIHLFTDGDFQCVEDDRVKCVPHTIESYGFPEATLLRYHIMTSVKIDTDYLFYLDVDMRVEDEVGDEILGDLVAIRHPGYFTNNGWGSESCDPRSMGYVPPGKQGFYYCGGFQGGGKWYRDAMAEMIKWIDQDTANGVMAQWHDETMWNKYLHDKKGFKVLDCSYCMPESFSKRRYHKIENMPIKILALEKELNYFRT